MTPFRSFIAACAILLQGCALQPMVHATSFRLVGFEPAVEVSIQRAADEWTAYGYPITISPDGDGEVVRLPVACERPTAAGCHAFGQLQEFIVLADTPAARRQWPDWVEFERIQALHEFGHALNLPDDFTRDPNVGGIMNYSATRAATHVQPCDLEALRVLIDGLTL